MSAGWLAALAAGCAVWLLLPGPCGAARERKGLCGWWWVPVLAAPLVPRALVVPAAFLGAGAVGAVVLWRRRSAARRAESNAARMAEACDLIAAELSAGRPAEAALEQAAAAWPAMAPAAAACRLGGDVPGALRELSRGPGAGGLRLLAGAWSVSQRTGGGLASATRRVAETVRAEQTTRRLVVGELASARATSRLVAALPVLALLMGSGAGADPWGFLLGTPYGWACLASGGGIGFLGLWWIEQIARQIEP